MARSTEQVFQDHVKAHLKAHADGDFAAMMVNYADDAVLMTIDSVKVGKAAIQEYIAEVTLAMPDAKMLPLEHNVHGDFVLFTWDGVTDAMTVHGVDTFVIHDDKIQLETVWFTIIPK